MNDPVNPLSATPSERKKFRASKIKLNEIHHLKISELMALVNVSKIRAMELIALSEFQSLPSVGVRFAHDLISMGYFRLHELKKKTGAKLTDAYELQCGVWADPCVEDQFRLVVHYANHPDSNKKWWDFTTERKAFRANHGYPASRPVKPWFELPRFVASSHINAVHADTKTDLARKLKLSLNYMKKNAARSITLAELADKAHLSQYHFLRCFRQAYEKTPFQYLTHLRLKLASQLLRKTKLPIHQIAFRSGFENDSSFIRLFKKEFGTTPLVFRTESRKSL